MGYHCQEENKGKVFKEIRCISFLLHPQAAHKSKEEPILKVIVNKLVTNTSN